MESLTTFYRLSYAALCEPQAKLQLGINIGKIDFWIYDLTKSEKGTGHTKKVDSKCKRAPEQIHICMLKPRLYSRANKIKSISISAGNIDRYAFLDVSIVNLDT